MNKLLIGIITAVMVLFPLPEEGFISPLKAWMQRYERFLTEQNQENFRMEAVEVEQKASKEKAEGDDVVREDVQSPDEVRPEDKGNAENETEVETAAEVQTEVQAVTEVPPETPAPAVVFPLYSVNGAVLREDVQEYLYQRLCEAGIGWFFEYSLLIAYQESRFDFLAENPNGRDKGLFQYRVEYHPTLDWRNPFAEADIFIQQMANRAYAGCDILTMISRHKQSDWGPYDSEYVAQVMQWQGRMVRIR